MCTRNDQTKMLNFMKYRARVSNDSEAVDALSVYTSLDNNEKRDFMQEFYKRGKSLKWALDYKKSIEISVKDVRMQTENFLTLSQILQVNGFSPANSLKLSDEEKGVAMQLIDDNKLLHGHDVQPILHEKMDCLSKFWYVKDDGRQLKRARHESESMTKSHSNAKAIQEETGDVPRKVKAELHPRDLDIKECSKQLKMCLGKLQKTAACLSMSIGKAAGGEDDKSVATLKTSLDYIQTMVTDCIRAKTLVCELKPCDDADEALDKANGTIAKAVLVRNVCTTCAFHCCVVQDCSHRTFSVLRVICTSSRLHGIRFAIARLTCTWQRPTTSLRS